MGYFRSLGRTQKSDFSYTPKPNFGSKSPKHKNKLCFGVNLSRTSKLSSINLEWLIDAYKKTPKKEIFFPISLLKGMIISSI